MQFRYVPKKDPPEPVATTAFLTPSDEGTFIQAGMSNTLKRIPSWLAISEILLLVYVVLAILAILGYAPFWIIGGLTKSLRRPAERVMASVDDLLNRMGNTTVWSVGFFLATIAFAVAAVASAIVAWRGAGSVRKSVRIYSMTVSLALVIATVYLAYWGVIGLQPWA